MAELRLRIVGECIIEVGERELTPDAPHLFALALYLGVEGARPISRAELCELLFPHAKDAKHAAHCLRQLLYRLRGLGVPIGVSASAIRLAGDPSTLGPRAAMSLAARSRTAEYDWTVLPSYAPQISDPFTDWLESLRERIAGDVRQLLQSDLQALQQDSDWEAVIRVARLCQQLDASNPKVTAAIAEALVFRGQRDAALQEIDAFIASHQQTAACSELARLRLRIEKASCPARPRQASLQGRKDALEALYRLWEQVRAGQTHLCVIHGSAGIGKTRLASEFATYASLHRGRRLSYRCDPIDVQRPLSVFSQLGGQLRALRGSIGASPSLKRYLDLLTGETEPQQQLEPAVLESTRREIAVALVDLIEAVSTEQPLLLAIDDAEFLDQASWTVLSSLCHKERRAAVLLLCCYRTGSASSLPPTRGRATIIQLKPLHDVDAAALLTELISANDRDLARLDQCVLRAGGNPLFLHALAHHWSNSDEGTAVPFDIRRLVSSQYLSLDSAARTLLESCLFLGRFATLRRLRQVAALGDAALLPAVRQLEDAGLLTSTAGEFRIPHALLADAVREFIPSTVSTVIQERVAKCLAEDYDGTRGSAPLAWAAAESWCRAGEPAAAVILLRRCAAQSASIGEPRAAAQTLRHIPLVALPPSEQASLLREAAEYAEIGRDYALLQTVSTEHLSLAHSLSLANDERTRSTLRVIEARIHQGEDPRQFVPELKNLLLDRSIPAELRVRAAHRLLSAADVVLDEDLAAWTAASAADAYQSLQVSDPDRMIAELMYTAYFARPEDGRAMALNLLEMYPEPSLARASISARTMAMFTLNRLGEHARAVPLYTHDHCYMKAHGVLSVATSDAVNLADMALAACDVESVRYWLREIQVTSDGKAPTAPAFYSLSADLALFEGRPEEATAQHDLLSERFRVADAPRMRAYLLAGQIRASIAKGEDTNLREQVRELRALYERGGHLGSQDIVVLALWLAEQKLGDFAGAAALLRDYLGARRRELGAVDAQLMPAAASDPECAAATNQRNAAAKSRTR